MGSTPPLSDDTDVNVNVSLLSLSVLREYFHRKNYTDTYEQFELEKPRSQDSVCKRLALVQLLHLQADYQHIVAARGPVTTVLELMTLYFIDNDGDGNDDDDGDFYDEVKCVATAVCREYLHRTSCHVSLSCLDQENRRSRRSISTRRALVQRLGVISLIHRYNLYHSPVLDVMVKGFLHSTVRQPRRLQKLQPLVTGSQPRVTGLQPLVTGQQPLVTGLQPAVTGPQPLVTGQQPLVTGLQPLVTGSQPLVTGPKPLVTGQQSLVTGQQPLVTGQQPLVTGQQPLVTGPQPKVTGQQPKVTGQPVSSAVPVVTRTSSGSNSAPSSSSYLASSLSSSSSSLHSVHSTASSHHTVLSSPPKSTDALAPNPLLALDTRYKKPLSLTPLAAAPPLSASEQKRRDVKKYFSSPDTSLESGDGLKCEDVDDDDDDDDGVSHPTPPHLHPPPTQPVPASEPITLKLATELKVLIFGASNKSFNPEWRGQSFTFCELPGLRYGIVQKKGGPCGLLAAVQALILRYLVFPDGRDPNSHSLESSADTPLNPTAAARRASLVSAVCRCLWRAGGGWRACVVVPGMRPHFLGGGLYQGDQLTETLNIHAFRQLAALRMFVEENVSQFECDGRSGCILFLYSIVLSRGISEIRRDMDVPTTSLVASHGYCTQEMVNLIVTGEATSNAFDNTVTLGEGEESLTLRGVAGRCEVGLLSLFEHYQSCEVGTYYKCPSFPIWIICSESHFSVLFSEKMLDEKDEAAEFDLFYYDGLAKQEEPIRLTVDVSGYEPVQYSDQQLIPPLEHCIRTKWKGARVEWNGYDPIL